MRLLQGARKEGNTSTICRNCSSRTTWIPINLDREMEGLERREKFLARQNEETGDGEETNLGKRGFICALKKAHYQGAGRGRPVSEDKAKGTLEKRVFGLQEKRHVRETLTGV